MLSQRQGLKNCHCLYEEERRVLQVFRGMKAVSETALLEISTRPLCFWLSPQEVHGGLGSFCWTDSYVSLGRSGPKCIERIMIMRALRIGAIV